MNLNQSPYEFEYVGGASNSYVFETTNEVTYQVKFKPTPYLFVNFPALGEQVYELVIELVYRPTMDKLRADPAIGPTVLAICRDFFANKERILLYICETADARHLARVRKLDAWFREFTTSNYLKLDIQFPDTNGLTYYISLIFRLIIQTAISSSTSLSCLRSSITRISEPQQYVSVYNPKHHFGFRPGERVEMPPLEFNRAETTLPHGGT